MSSRTYGEWSDDGQRYHLVECPACGFELRDYEQWQLEAHLLGHSPEEFGLAPIGERRGQP